MAGTLNTVYFYSKYKIINNLPKLVPGGRETFGWNSNAEKRSWLDKQYESYGNPTARTTDKNYRHGVQPESGSKSFNSDINYNND